MKNVPHLPPPSCSIAAHTYMQRLPWVLFIIFLALLSGVSAAIVSVVYVLPRAEEMPNFSSVPSALPGARTLPSGVQKNIQDRRLELFSLQSVRGAFALESGRLGYAYMLSSDGWAVVPRVLSLDEAYVGFDALGTTSTVRRVVIDAVFGISYVQFADTGHRVLSLYNSSDVWDIGVYSGNVFSFVEAPVFNAVTGPETLASFVSPISSFTKKDVLFSGDGELFGIVNEKGRVVSARVLSHGLRAVLSGNIPAYAHTDAQCESADGFLPSREGAGSVRTSACVVFADPLRVLRSGDVIFSVNGKSWSREAAEDLLFGSVVVVNFYRDGALRSVSW